MTTLLSANSPAVERFLVAWHENGRIPFERFSPNLTYDLYDRKTAADKTRWICLDYGTYTTDGREVTRSGRFLVDRATGEVYTIKAYGRPNRKIGTLESLTAEYEAATATHARGTVRTYHSNALGRVTIPE